MSQAKIRVNIFIYAYMGNIYLCMFGHILTYIHVSKCIHIYEYKLVMSQAKVRVPRTPDPATHVANCLCLHTRTNQHIRTRTRPHVQRHMSTLARARIHTHTNSRTRTHSRTHSHIHSRTHARTHERTHVRTHR